MSPKAHKDLHHNVILVDKLWNLKRLCEAHLKIHIPLGMVLKDEDYRTELLRKALETEHEELVALVWDIRKMEGALFSAKLSKDELKGIKKSTKSFRMRRLTAAFLAVMFLLSGYLLRSFLPMDSGEVFVLKMVQNARIESTLKNKKIAHANGGSVTQAERPLFRLHGSNTVGENLAPRLVEAYLVNQGATNVHTGNGAKENEKIVSGEINGSIEFIEVAAHGSGTAFVDLLNGNADLGMSSRPIKEQERVDLIAKTGDLSLPGSEHIIGLDGLAIIVAPSNDISTLSLVQIADIFSGKITHWSALGGKDIPIKLYARDEKSGTWDTFKNLVLDTQKVKLLTTATRLESSTDLSDTVARESGAIGFIGLPYVRHSKVIAVSSGANTKAIMPMHFTVSTEDYPLARRLYIYSPQSSTNDDALEFVNFVATEHGQSIVEKVGFVSQNIKEGKPFDKDFYPAEMREIISRSQRLSINFRFKSGSDELDTKALNDLDRVAKYVEANAPKRIQLFGFSDDEDEINTGGELSLRRARMVEQQLIRRGIYPLVTKGMGHTAPLASSETEAGKNINRRVEVWML